METSLRKHSGVVVEVGVVVGESILSRYGDMAALKVSDNPSTASIIHGTHTHGTVKAWSWPGPLTSVTGDLDQSQRSCVAYKRYTARCDSG